MPENDNYAQEGKPVAPEGASVDTDSMIWNAKSLQSVVKKLEWASISGIPISEIEKYNIQSFQPTESEQAGWDGVTFAKKTVEKHFSTPSDSAPVNIAKRVFLESLGKLNPGDGSDSRKQFEEATRREISKIPDFDLFPMMKAINALSGYSQKILDQVINHLSQRGASQAE